MDEPRPGTYLHYKGGLYRVIGVGQYSDGPMEDDVCVLYESLAPKGCKYRVRSLADWNKPVNGKPRFRRVQGY